jgi:hypothetical protein
MKNSKRIAAVALGAAMMITTAPSYGQADTLHVYGVGAETCKKVARLAKNKADLEVYEFFVGGMMTAFTLTSDLYQVSRDKERDTGVFVTRMVVDYCKEHPNDYLATVAPRRYFRSRRKRRLVETKQYQRKLQFPKLQFPAYHLLTLSACRASARQSEGIESPSLHLTRILK